MNPPCRGELTPLSAVPWLLCGCGESKCTYVVAEDPYCSPSAHGVTCGVLCCVLCVLRLVCPVMKWSVARQTFCTSVKLLRVHCLAQSLPHALAAAAFVLLDVQEPR